MIKGAGRSISTSVPPDLFLSARQSVPLRLKYDYASVSGRDAALHVRLNAQDVESVHLPAVQAAQDAETVWLPTGRLRPYANTLTIDFDPGRDNVPGDVWPSVAIHQDSSIDLRGIPHSVILPRLELFADAGYPFTAWADLGRTAIVIPETPGRGEYEALLNIAGAFGAQTGSAASAITVATAARLEVVRDKDLIVPTGRPRYHRLGQPLTVELSTRGARVDATSLWSRVLHPQWPFLDADRDRLTACRQRPLC